MSDDFNVYAPKWLWGLLTVFTVTVWTSLFFVATKPEPLVVHRTGIDWVDKSIVIIFFTPLIIGPVWGFVRFSSQLFISNGSITVRKIYRNRLKQYSIHDIIETKLRGEKYHKDTLRITFSDGNKLTVEKFFTNFDRLKLYLRDKRKLAK